MSETTQTAADLEIAQEQLSAATLANGELARVIMEKGNTIRALTASRDRLANLVWCAAHYGIEPQNAEAGRYWSEAVEVARLVAPENPANA